MTRLLALAIAILFAAVLSSSADEDDCQSAMSSLTAAQGLVATDIANIDALEAAIAAPDFDPVSDGWMIDALGWCNDDLVADLNEAAVYAERAHEAHCY